MGQPSLYLHQLGTDQGLSQSENQFFHRTSDGQVLISTNDGLNVFDGQQISKYKDGLDNSIGFKGIVIQSDFFEVVGSDKIWFSTNEALVCYNSVEQSFQSFNLHETAAGGHHYPFYLEQNRFLWVKCSGRLLRFDTQNPEAQSNQVSLASVGFIRATAQTDENGKVNGVYGGYWMDPGLEVYQFNEDLSINYQDTLYDGREDESIHYIVDLVATANGQLWLMGTSDELLTINTSNLSEIQTVTDLGSISAFHYEAGSPFLYLFSDIGLLQFKHEDGTQQVIVDKIGGLRNRRHFIHVNSLYIDSNETIWLGRRDEGVYFGKLINSQTRSVLDREQLPFNYYSFWLDPLQNYIHTRGEMADRIPAFPLLSFSATGELLNEHPSSYIDLYFGADALGAYGALNDQLSWQQQGEEAFIPGPITINLWDMNGQAFLKPAYQLISLGSDFFSYDYQEEQWISLPQMGKIKAFEMLVADGQYLFADHANTTISITPFRFEQDELIIDSAEIVQSELGIVNDFYYDSTKQVVWVASSKGLFRFSANGQERHFFEMGTEFPSQYIMSIQQDEAGHLWLSSNEGIFSVSIEEDQLSLGYHFTARDGLSSNEFRAGESLQHPSGYLWFGSIKGFDVFHPDSLQIVSNPPQLLLQDIRIFDEPWESDTPIRDITEINLKHWENTLNFRLAAPEYTDPDRTQFEVYLSTTEGNIDTNAIGENYTFTLPNLPPGRYQFGFNAASAQGVWASEPHWISIYIKPPLLQRPWFQAVLGLLILGLVSLGNTLRYRYRLRLQKGEADLAQAQLQTKIDLEEQRRKITEGIHNKMGGNLTTISMLSYRIAKSKELSKAKEISKRIESRVRETRRRFSSFLRVVHPDFDGLGKSLKLIRSDAADFLQDNGLEAKFDWKSDYPDRKLAPDFRLGLLELIEELLNNIVKYAEASEVSMRLKIPSQKRLEINIQDNGKGFSPSSEDFEKGIGLSSLQQISERLGGSLKYSLPEEGGTLTEISLPLPVNGLPVQD